MDMRDYGKAISAILLCLFVIPPIAVAQTLDPLEVAGPADGAEILRDQLSEASILLMISGIAAEATNIRFQISEEDEFSNTIIDTVVGITFSQRRLNLLRLADHIGVRLYWRAMQLNGAEESEWTAPHNFFVVLARTVTLNDPGFNSRTITLTWDRLDEADTYRSQLATDDAFSSVVRDTTIERDPFPFVTFHDLQPNTRYFWRVRAQNVDAEGRWSAIGTIVTDRYGFFDGAFQVGENRRSDVHVFASNNGIIGFDPSVVGPGIVWPRGSDNIYAFGSGLWFGALKVNNGVPREYVVTSYNPGSGHSMMTPGRIDDGPALDEDPGAITRYAGHFATDFNANGDAIDTTERRWPLWRGPGDELYGDGAYVAPLNDRTREVHPAGPAYLSHEDYFCTYKDTDLSFYDDNDEFERNPGYPLGLQCELRMYSWVRDPVRDGIIVHHTVINRSSDTLRDCFIGHVVDYDLALRSNRAAGASNDRARFYDEDPDLELALQWTELDQGEIDNGFGYAGLALLESPSIDAEGRLRSDKRRYERNEQVGLSAFHNWFIQEDPPSDIEQYNLLSSPGLDTDAGPGDQRFLAPCGPFTMFPGDTARLAIAMVFAPTALGGEAVGTTLDVAELVATTRAFREAYDNLPVGVTYPAHSQRRTLTLGPSRPNPANERLVIELVASNAGLASFTVVDLTGAIVRRLSPRFVFPGKHTITLAVEDLAPGAYVIDAHLNGARALSPVRIVR